MTRSTIVERVSLWAFAGLVVAAGLIDLTTYLIPNGLPLAICIAFAASSIALRRSPKVVGGHLLCGLATLIVGMTAFALNLAGGGDGKLLAAISLWLGWPALKRFVPATLAVGAVMMLALAGLRSGMVLSHLPPIDGWAARLFTPGDLIPYGPALACGALIALPATAIFKALKASPRVEATT